MEASSVIFERDGYMASNMEDKGHPSETHLVVSTKVVVLYLHILGEKSFDHAVLLPSGYHAP